MNEPNRRLTRNAVRCRVCDTVLESKHRHDYRTCDCPNQTMVDGGLAYQRWGGANPGLVENLAEYEDVPEICQDSTDSGTILTSEEES